MTTQGGVVVPPWASPSFNDRERGFAPPPAGGSPVLKSPFRKRGLPDGLPLNRSFAKNQAGAAVFIDAGSAV